MVQLDPSVILSKIRLLDAYPKTLEDFRVKTSGGALVTLSSCIIAMILFVSELNYFLSSQVHEELIVDVSRGDRLKINFDIVFHKIACPFLSADAIDVSGEQHINIEHNIFKRRLDLSGKAIDEAQRDHSIGVLKQEFIKKVTTPAPTLDPGRCESCYGAETVVRKCCNACSDVRDAYNDKGWALRDVSTIAQCIREGVKSSDTGIEKEGCQVFGYVEVARVGGNFHIAPGRSLVRNHHHMHDLSMSDASSVNTSHTINHLFFGPQVPGKKDPLDASFESCPDWSMAFQYYVKIVATKYLSLDGKTLDAYQFAVTRNRHRTDESVGEHGLPGVFFVYEFAPMMVKYTEVRKSFLHFLTSVFAIIGGVFTVAGIVDAVLYHSVNLIRHKMQMGKLI